VLDVDIIRAEFPALARNAAGRPMVYLDSAASALKVRAAIDAVTKYYTSNGANVHRGLHSLSQEASEAFEECRAHVARFIGASADDEVVFTKNATEALNIVAAGLGLRPGDNIVGTIVDHHSNILPWQARCEYRCANVLSSPERFAEVIAELADDHTRAIVAPLYSNVTGARLPVEELVPLARRLDVPLVVDAAQGGGHVPLRVGQLGADFVALSAHKMCGPTGVGVLYGRREQLQRLSPVIVGGGTVATLDLDAEQPVVFRLPPWRFEAGTQDIAAVLGLRAAVRFLEGVGMERIHQHVMAVWRAGMEEVQKERLDEHFEIRTGAADDNVGIIAFAPRRKQVDAVRLSQILSDTYGVMARAGSHCAHPLHKALGWRYGSLRFSVQLYNTVDELGYAVRSLAAATRML
jgi:cysteine desulfurase / selenocysteine lyase